MSVFDMFALPQRVAELDRKVDHLMALGTETTKALAELRAAITTESAEAADRIARLVADATDSDAVTAEAIRAELAGVAGIIPNDPAGTDIPTAGTPAGEPSGEPVPGEEPVQ